jgi:hypothetical protein
MTGKTLNLPERKTKLCSGDLGSSRNHRRDHGSARWVGADDFSADIAKGKADFAVLEVASAEVAKRVSIDRQGRKKGGGPLQGVRNPDLKLRRQEGADSIGEKIVVFLETGQERVESENEAVETAVGENPAEFEEDIAPFSTAPPIDLAQFPVDPIDHGVDGGIERRGWGRSDVVL